MSAELKTVLVVDDTPDNLDLMRALLSPHYKVKVAINGEVALKLVAASAPHIILLDVMMPGINGYEVCQRLHDNPATRDIPVVLVTAISEAMDEGKGFEAGAVDYISKPVSGPVVLSRVRTHLRVRALKHAARAALLRLDDGDCTGGADILRSILTEGNT
jgi:putative two-component system response regulator